MSSDEISIELGKRLAKIRSRMNISQEELANTSNVSRTYISEIERGQRSATSITIIANLAKALGTSLSVLFADIETADDDSDEIAANNIYNQAIFKTCYPPKNKYYNVSTLLEFVVYLPLISPNLLLDSLERIGGSVHGNEGYVLKQLNSCISHIPTSPAKEFADKQAGLLNSDNNRNRAESCSEDEFEKFGAINEEYLNKIRHFKDIYHLIDRLKK